MKKQILTLLFLSISFTFCNTATIDLMLPFVALRSGCTHENLWKFCTFATISYILMKDLIIPGTKNILNHYKKKPILQESLESIQQNINNLNQPKTLIEILQRSNTFKDTILAIVEPRFQSVDDTIAQINTKQAIGTALSEFKVNNLNPLRIQVESMQRSIELPDNSYNLRVNPGSSTYEVQQKDDDEQKKRNHHKKKRNRTPIGYRNNGSDSIPLYDDSSGSDAPSAASDDDSDSGFFFTEDGQPMK